MLKDNIISEATIHNSTIEIHYNVVELYGEKPLKRSKCKHLFDTPEDAIHYLERKGFTAYDDGRGGTKLSIVTGSTRKIARIELRNIFKF